MLDINHEEAVQIKNQTADFGSRIAQAMLHGKPEDLNREIQAALQSGLFADNRSLNDSIEAGLRGQMMPRLQRQQLNEPKIMRVR